MSSTYVKAKYKKLNQRIPSYILISRITTATKRLEKGSLEYLTAISSELDSIAARNGIVL